MTAEAAMVIAKLVAGVSPFPWPDDGSKHEAWVQVLAGPSSSDIRDDIAVATASRLLGEMAPDKLSPAQLILTCRTKPALPRNYRALPPPEDASGPALRPIYFPRNSGKEPFPVAQPDEYERERMRRHYARSAAHPALLASRRDLGITNKHLEEARDERENELERHREHVAQLEAQSDLTAEERAVLKRAQAKLDQAREQHATERKPSKFAAALEGTLMRLAGQMSLACRSCGLELDGADLRAYVAACMQAGRSGGDAPLRRCVDCSEPVRVVEQWDEQAIPF